jgi:regulator of RNase E activity RraA
VLSDVLDGFGLTRQAMRPFIRPLDDDSVLFGRARTGLFGNAYAVAESENPYELEIALLDDLRPGEVVVFACNGPTDRIAPWGELLTTAAGQRQAAGCVTDGLVRDVRQIRKLGFPVFHGGIGPLDSRGRARMTAMDVPVECAGAPVVSGDLVFGDVDGVVIVPQRLEEDVIQSALDKVKGENNTRDELLRGAYLRDVYAKYGVL